MSAFYSGAFNPAAFYSQSAPVNNYELDASAASFSVSGISANTDAARLVDASSVSSSITGNSLEFLRSIILDPSLNVFTTSGQQAELLTNRISISDSGIFDIQGTISELFISKILDAESTSFSISGEQSSEVSNRFILTESGVFFSNGVDCSLIGNRLFTPDAAVGEIGSQTADVFTSRNVDASQVAFTSIGQESTGLFDKTLHALPGLSEGTFVGFTAELSINRQLDTAIGQLEYTGQFVEAFKDSGATFESGNFVLLGQSADVVSHRKGEFDQTTLGITSTESSLIFERVVLCDPNNFSKNFAEVEFTRNHVLSLLSTDFTVTGQDANLSKNSILSADVNQFDTSGAHILPLRSLIVDVSPNSFSVSGVETSGIKNYAIECSAGTFDSDGKQTSEFTDRYSNFEFEVYSVVGSNSELLVHRLVDCAAISCNITGIGCELKTSRFVELSDEKFSIETVYSSGYSTGYVNSNSSANLVFQRTLGAAKNDLGINGSSVEFVYGSVFPDPSEVRAGVRYGPNGIYVGTLNIESTYSRSRVVNA